MRSSTRRSRKMGPPGLVEKRPLYVQLMKEGHSNRAACRILGINPNTGLRWLHGRNGVEGLVQQGLYPRHRTRAFVGCMHATGWRAWCSKDWIRGLARRLLHQVGQAAICQRTNGSSLPTGCWFGRVFNPSLVILGGPRPQSAGSWLGIVPTHVAIIRSAQKMAQKWRPRPRLAKLAADDELRHYVVECLSKRWSPQQVCRALKERFPGEKARHLVHETVYRALYHLSIRPRSSRVCPAAAIG